MAYLDGGEGQHSWVEACSLRARRDVGGTFWNRMEHLEQFSTPLRDGLSNPCEPSGNEPKLCGFV